MKKLLIFKCKLCGNVAIKIVDKNVPLYCCGQEMEVLNINTTDGVVEKHMPVVEVSGDKIEAIHMIPGWTHNIINLSETENLVTVMTCNEIFNPERPDTFFEEV